MDIKEEETNANNVAYYRPGEVVYSGLPFAHVVFFKERENYCDNCMQRSNLQLKRCVLCRYVYYCGKKCQKRAWNNGIHKDECPHLFKLKELRQDFVRLVGRIILLLKEKEWNSCQESVGNLQRSFDDLVCCYDVMDDKKLSLFGFEILYLLKQYLGEENLPNDDTVLKIIGKVKHNNFEIHGIASALYIGGSVFEHACIPNAVRVFEGIVMKVRAIIDVPREDIKKVTVSYCLMLGANNYCENTKRLFNGNCKCDDCLLPYEKSVLNKILDKYKASNVIENAEYKLKELAENGDGSIIPQMVVSDIEELLNEQENILGDTNLLRMRLITFKIFYEQDLNERIYNLKTLAKSAEKAFGENSEELMWIYEMLNFTCHQTGNIPASKCYQKKLQTLQKLLYDHSRQRNTPSYEKMFTSPAIEKMLSSLFNSTLQGRRH